MIKISIAVPALYEYENLKILIPKIKESVKKEFSKYEVEILVIDGIQKDLKTLQFCQNNNVKYLSRSGKNTFGDAIRTIINSVNVDSDWLIIMDSDGSHNPKFFKKFKIEIEKNEVDIVIASRYVKGGSTDNSVVLIFMSRVVNIIYRILFNLNIRDISNNFRLYRFNLIKDLKLVESNFDIVEEILIKSKSINNGLRIIEYPYRFEKRIFGKSKRNLLLFFITFPGSLYRLKKYLS